MKNKYAYIILLFIIFAVILFGYKKESTIKKVLTTETQSTTIVTRYGIMGKVKTSEISNNAAQINILKYSSSDKKYVQFHTINTESDGNFLIDNIMYEDLSGGKYSLEIVREGFLKYTVNDIELDSVNKKYEIINLGEIQLIPGDTNSDGEIEISDLAAINDNYTNEAAEGNLYDYNNDLKVNEQDREILKMNYGKKNVEQKLSEVTYGLEYSNTQYKVQYYIENLDDTNFTMYQEDTLYEISNIIVQAQTIEIVGFTYNQGNENEVLSSMVNKNGTTILKLYYTRNSYNLYVEKGAHISSVSSSKVCKYDESFSISATVDSAIGYEYTFLHWKINNLNNITYNNSQTINGRMPANDVYYTAYASEETVEYSITYDLDGGILETENPEIYTINSQEFTLNVPTKDGCIFLGWLEDSATIPDKTVLLPGIKHSNLHYTAIWEDDLLINWASIGDYVNYINNGVESYAMDETASGTGQNQTVPTENFSWRVLDINNSTGEITLISENASSTAVRLAGANGYNNIVYLLNDICNELYSSSIGSARSISLDDIENYSSFDYTQGSSGVNGQQYGTVQEYTGMYAHYPKMAVYDKNVQIDDASFGTLDKSKQTNLVYGYDFATKLSVTSTSYAYNITEYMNTDKFNLITQNGNNESLTYYLATRTMAVHGEYSSNASCCIPIVYGSYIGIDVPYNSNGEENAISRAYRPIVKIVPNVKTSGKDDNGNWKLAGTSIKYNLNNGTTSSFEQTKYKEKEVKISEINMERPGYKFLGWGTSENDVTVDYLPGKVYNIDENLTLYAIWEREIYTITYNPGEYGTFETQTYQGYYGDPTPEFVGEKTSSNEEYVFVKWSPVVNEHISQSVDYVAQWVDTVFTISYDLDGGVLSDENPTSYAINSETFTLNNPTKENYTFLGWTGSNGNEPELEVTIEQGTSEDKNYIANWRENGTGRYRLVYVIETLNPEEDIFGGQAYEMIGKYYKIYSTEEIDAEVGTTVIAEQITIDGYTISPYTGEFVLSTAVVEETVAGEVITIIGYFYDLVSE